MVCLNGDLPVSWPHSVLAMKAICPLTFILVSTFPLAVLSQTDYKGFQDNPRIEKELSTQVSEKLQKDLSSLSGTNKKFIGELYKERSTSILKKIDENELITNEEVQAYLEKLLASITSKNQAK